MASAELSDDFTAWLDDVKELERRLGYPGVSNRSIIEHLGLDYGKEMAMLQEEGVLKPKNDGEWRDPTVIVDEAAGISDADWERLRRLTS